MGKGKTIVPPSAASSKKEQKEEKESKTSKKLDPKFVTVSKHLKLQLTRIKLQKTESESIQIDLEDAITKLDLLADSVSSLDKKSVDILGNSIKEDIDDVVNDIDLALERLNLLRDTLRDIKNKIQLQKNNIGGKNLSHGDPEIEDYEGEEEPEIEEV